MIDVAWAVVRNDNRYLLAQRSEGDIASGTWCFPSSQISPTDSPSGAANRELRLETGLVASNMQQVCETQLENYNVHIVECIAWSGKPYPADETIIGLGWFTIPEIWNLDRSLAPFLVKILPQFTFLMRHRHGYKDTRKDAMLDE